MAECNLPKVDVEGSIPFSRSTPFQNRQQGNSVHGYY